MPGQDEFDVGLPETLDDIESLFSRHPEDSVYVLIL
jgi:hypothetical protein